MQRRAPAFFAMIILGFILLLAGIVYGLGSRHVQYKSVAQGSIAHYLSADGTGYLQMENNPTLYIVHQDNFTPKLATFADSDTISFVYDPAETMSVDVKSTLGTHLVGTASKVVAITAIDTTGKKTYTTPEYVSNPQGYDHNQWPLGLGLLIAGLLLMGGSFFLPKKKSPPIATSSNTINTPMPVWQPQSALQQNTPPYGQSVQQTYPTTPYPPTQHNYPVQNGPFQQISSPNYPVQNGPFQQASGATYPQQPPAPFGQLPPRPFDSPQYPNQQPPQQRPSGPSGSQFLRPKPFEPPQQQ